MNANAEDSSTFGRLKEEMAESGLLDLPSVQRLKNGKYRVISGEHRIRAWLEDHKEIPAVVAQKRYEREDEFSKVQNMNLVRGRVTLSKLRSVMKEHDLDPSKVKLHGIPPWMLGDVKSKLSTEEQARRAHDMEVKKLALSIAEALAAMILEERDEDGLLILEAQNKAVVMAGFGANVAWLRDRRKEVKEKLLNRHKTD